MKKGCVVAELHKLQLHLLQSREKKYPYLAVLLYRGMPIACQAPLAHAWHTVHHLLDALRRLCKAPAALGGAAEQASQRREMLLQSLGVELFACWLAPFWFVLQPLLGSGRPLLFTIVADRLEQLLLPWEILCWPETPCSALDSVVIWRRTLGVVWSPWAAGNKEADLWAQSMAPRLTEPAPQALPGEWPGELRLLIAVARPSGFATRVEESALCRLQQMLQANPALHCCWLMAATRQQLREQIDHFAPQVVCLLGAALLQGEQGFFVFEEADGSAEVRSAAEVMQEIAPSGSVHLLLLLGREEGHPPAVAAMAALSRGVVAQGLPWALLVPASVEDPGVDLFLTVFLQQLVEGASVEHSLLRARHSASAAGQGVLCPTWILPVLFGGTTLSTSQCDDQHASVTPLKALSTTVCFDERMDCSSACQS
ncbi:CHAT domain-containing protein [Candidatus Magnetaquicoccus inordinatus]|uniref:CHAT domain-containing protein n=1 Tax=Candidatus Magnetaquicoccus inordinatus TaxID=2496818 RepID=UPI001D0ED2FD|nr:CHAT domain-containing protein [Candidatus Magnetaquicoccus inordinatus]